MKIVSTIRLWAGGAALRLISAPYAAMGRFFYARPALKRGLLALCLFGLLALPLQLVFAAGVALWACFLLGLFLGMGAERACTDWGDTFALPRPRDFAFWRWHALERKRFCAVLIALAAGLLASTLWGLVR